MLASFPFLFSMLESSPVSPPVVSQLKFQNHESLAQDLSATLKFAPLPSACQDLAPCPNHDTTNERRRPRQTFTMTRTYLQILHIDFCQQLVEQTCCFVQPGTTASGTFQRAVSCMFSCAGTRDVLKRGLSLGRDQMKFAARPIGSSVLLTGRMRLGERRE